MPGGEEAILDDLRWLGIAWDEGPVRQSERARAPPRGRPAAGLPQRFEGVMLWRDDGTPTFHLASVVDDIDFEITHVIRGSDHRPNEPLHAALAPRARARAAGGDPPRPRRRRRREEALEARRGRDGRVAARGRVSRRGGARLPRGARAAAARRAPRSRPHPLALGRRARRASDDELAERLGVPVEAVPLRARRARPGRGARARTRRPRPAECRAARRAPRRSARFVELRSRLPDVLDKDEAKALHPRAEGGRRQPARAARRADRRDRGPELWAVLRALPRDEALRRALTSKRAALRHVHALARRAARAARPGADVLLRPDRLRARAHRQRAAVRRRDVAALVAARARGYDATLVHNITDVNDKIYDAAPGASAELAARATAWYLEDTGDLGLGMPDHLPKATEHVPQIVRFIEELVERGHAYPVEGDVYFRVARFPEYGRLSGQRPDQVEEQEPNPLKEDGRDFALWKANKPETEDTWWDSPWGRGRPGWHIECSAMAEEISARRSRSTAAGSTSSSRTTRTRSRSRGRSAIPFAQIWAHNGMLRFTGEKMSKSLGNVATIREALDEWGRETVLVFFLDGHWRKPIDFSRRDDGAGGRPAGDVPERLPLRRSEHDEGDWERFAAALDDDFDTPAALAVLHEWASGGQPSCSGAGSRSSASSRSPSATRRRPRSSELAEPARRGPRRARLRGGRPAARRARGARLGDARRARTATTSSAR